MPVRAATAPEIRVPERWSSLPPERRVEGPAKLSGRARFTADLAADDALELAFVTVDEPHALIEAVDTRAALARTGVRLVLTGADVAGVRAGRMLLDQPLLAETRVRFAGERVAVVAAESRRVAEDAARRIEVRLRPQAPLLDPLAALTPGAPLLHPDAAAYRYLAGTRPPVSHPNLQGEVIVEHEAAGLTDAFATARKVFEHTFTTPREHQGYLEPHATLVEHMDGGRLRVRSSNKHPFLLRNQLATSLGLEPESLLIEAPHIGGDFGGKGAPFDEPICCLIALRTGRAVRYVMSYEEELRATNPRHATQLRLRTAVDGDGRITAHEAEVVFDGGAYAAGTPVPSLLAGIATPAGGLSTLTAYHVPSARIVFRQPYTTSVPTGHMRAPGEVQTQFASEHHLDLIAQALEVTPLAFRRRHAARGPQRGAGGERFRAARGGEVLDALEREAARRPLGVPGAGHVRGRGFALGVRELHGGRCGVRLRLREDGHAELLTAQPDQGGGAHSMLQRIAANSLGVPVDDVIVRQGDTDTAPFDMGSAASRVTWVAGKAAQDAAEQLKANLERAAAPLIGAAVVLHDGAFQRDDGPATPLAALAPRLAALAASTVEASRDGAHAPGEHADHCFSGYLVDVELDPATGALALLEATLVADIGAVINPIAHAGQLQGGFAMGVGAALMEELGCEDGRITTTTLAHYKLPTALDVPVLCIVVLEPDAGPGPFGAKFAGELSTSGVAPAIANAIANACGASVRDLPLTAERVHAALASAREPAPAGTG
jgi:CO/xanthine dehydrogenase Mo-binding subunit